MKEPTEGAFATMDKSIAELRRDYTLGALSKTSVDPDPIKQFQRWLQEAIAAQLPEPNAMTVATADLSGHCHARAMLLKVCDANGFVFFTNYQSDKGQQLLENPHVALVFLWLELQRQVRIEGTVTKISSAESEAYFHTRPRESRLGALVSQQSQVVASRKQLDERFQQLAAQYPDDVIPMPEHWGGYRVWPVMMEFWQGRQGRLHDRLRYRREEKGWRLERLEP
ncbi:Pyridoxine/pyridoxamine 5'-phosphate oxidase [Candidatus Competibacter denitrificans Run_A_D11]|uniref:Pyridoxine/pyridoxamine 5'-phosphate oxidase n=2 Tax=Candidatus Competibacter TaxID=221279 RepID=W6M070_9GAMM|nr:Pyridoxine/pyridoxamine 5'-phosphate oxidase [Candidatus Competibacter denitrificans Run_A_D11]